MNNSGNPLTLPIKPSTRSHTLNVRLTAQEKADIAALAQRQGVTSSHMARHFLVQAIAYYKRRAVEDSHDPDQW
ncbi:MAG: hypothetical protein K8I82_07805 [Anaerolineae bacterium]|nr:hypothetical protein [Anaerolineae bacterium]